jgi:hypothetical protein
MLSHIFPLQGIIYACVAGAVVKMTPEMGKSILVWGNWLVTCAFIYQSKRAYVANIGHSAELEGACRNE